MRLTSIALENWLCHRHLKLDFSPLTIVSGPNEAGKSAIRDAIAFAMLAELTRVTAKGDRDLLVTQGATSGRVGLGCQNGELAMTYLRDISSGKGNGLAMPIGEHAVPAVVPYVLDPALFAHATIDTRRNLLLAVMRVGMDPKSIKVELERRRIASWERMFHLPDSETLPQWIVRCEKLASEARGGWKQITGETYGPVKAEDWEAPRLIEPDPERMQVLEAEISALRAKQSDLTRQVGAMEERQRLKAAQVQQRLSTEAIRLSRADAEHQLQMASNRLTAAEEQQRLAEEEVQNLRRRQLIVACVHGTNHLLVGNVLEETDLDPSQQASPADYENATARLGSARVAVTTAMNVYENQKARLARLAAAEVEPETEAGSELPYNTQGHEREIAAIGLTLQTRMDELAALHGAGEDASAALKETDQAAALHAEVQAWTTIAKAIAPGGIPAERLQQAIAPFNEQLASLTAAFGLDWPTIALGPDMELYRGSMPYGLLSESAKWKADATIALALAILSDLKFAVIDRFDVLGLPARKPCLAWLDDLTKNGMLDTVILLGTLKEPPKAPGRVKVIWLGEPAHA